MARPLNVLIGCECSGVVREAFRALGHNAYSCDLKVAEDGSPYHIQADLRTTIALPHNWGLPAWDLLIAHPDCTYLCNSGVSRLTRPAPANASPGVLYGEDRWAAMRTAAQFFTDLQNAPIPYVALENPIMHGYAWIRKPDQTIQPYQFGDDASKRTGLWLKGVPKLEPLSSLDQWASPRKVTDARGIIRYRWSNQTDSGQNKLTPGPSRAADRARTYQGIARAMAEQWGRFVQERIK